MKQITKNIFIILAAVIIIDQIFSYAFIHLIFKRTVSGESGGTINYVISRKKDLDFLVLGSSRAKNSIDPEQLTSLGKKGYNLGINGSTALNSLLVLDILTANGVKPKTIIFQTDLFEFVPDTDQNTVEQIKRLYPYDTKLVEEYVGRVGILERIKFSFGLYRLNRKILNVAYNFMKRNSIVDSNGHVGLPNATEALDELSVSEKYTYDETGLNAEALRRMKKICDENGIRLIVVFPPSYKNVGYSETEQAKLVQSLHNEHFSAVIDLADVSLSPAVSQQENWRDSFHFSSLGAERFSKILNGELSRK